jgi:hypothetical protein
LGRGGKPSAATPAARTEEAEPGRARTREEGKGQTTAPKRLAPDVREKLVAAIAAARKTRIATRGEEASSGEDPGTLDKDYIRERMNDIVPLVKECYENALRDQPELHGRIVVEFTISGEPGLGAVIEDSKILEESSITDASLRECVQESMYALEMRAPERGGRVVVRYPYILEPHGP